MTDRLVPQPTRPLRWLLALLLVGLVALPALALARSEMPPPRNDYVAYWAAGRLHAAGANPYDPEQILAVQRSVGWAEARPRMIWYPPWALPILMPFGVLPYPASQYLWFVLNLGLLLFCADRLWRAAGGPLRRGWPAWLLALTFAPGIIVLTAGQISVLSLLGVVLFLHCAARGRWFAAGAAVALLAIKPQALFLVWIVLLLWVVRTRRWQLPAGALAALAVLTALAHITDPAILAHWLQAVRTHPPDYWITPTFGSLLRLAFGWDAAWLALVAPALGLVWAVLFWRRHRAGWQWAEALPWLLLVSLVTAPFAWMFDQVVLLAAVIPALAGLLRRGPRLRAAGYIALFVLINAVALATVSLTAPIEQGAGGKILTLADPSRAWGAWQAPAVLVWYDRVRRR